MTSQSTTHFNMDVLTISRKRIFILLAPKAMDRCRTIRASGRLLFTKSRCSVFTSGTKFTKHDSWSTYWDSLKLFSPAGFSSLPGMKFPGKGDRHLAKAEMISYLTEYARRFQFYIKYGGERIAEQAGSAAA